MESGGRRSRFYEDRTCHHSFHQASERTQLEGSVAETFPGSGPCASQGQQASAQTDYFPMTGFGDLSFPCDVPGFPTVVNDNDALKVIDGTSNGPSRGCDVSQATASPADQTIPLQHEQITISDTDLLIQYGSQSHIFQEIDEERFQEVLTLLTATDEQRRAMMHAAARAGYLGAAYTPEQRQEALARYRYKKSRRGKFHRPVDECRSRIAQQMNRTHNGRFHSRSGSVADGGSMSASIDTTALFSGDRRGTHRRFMSMETVGSVPPLSPRMAALHHPATPSPCAGRPPRPNSSSPGGPVVPELPNLAALQAQAQGHAHGHAGNPHGLSMWSPRSAEGVPSRIESGEGPQLSGEASESLTAAGSIGIEQAFLDGLGMGTLRGSYGLPRGGSTSELGHMLQGGTWVHDGGRGGHGQGAGGAQAVPPSHLHTWGQPPPSGALR